ncbi:MFS transporter [Pseudokineococcus basanitobsidens]|uniref:MFS transporter n=1 Tax=Pseudokineococcus basanitobsidens TaxID=1926649 RepID=A0ABU8RN64_9ACTN
MSGPATDVRRAGAARRAPQAALVVAAVLVLALSLRGPIVTVAPVLARVQDDLGLTAATAGLLTTIPVVCFAVMTPLASALIARAGPETAVWACLAGITVGVLLRSSGGGTGVVLAGTAVIGTAITIGNIVVPVIIRRSVRPSRAGGVTGAYTAALNVGAMLTSLGTEPLAARLGWRTATASWLVLVVVGALLWALATVRRRRLPEDPPAERGARAGHAPHVARQPGWAPWLLMLGFGGQAFSYYGLTAWLPTLLADRVGQSAATAGAASSVFQLLAVVGALGVPVLLARSTPVVALGVVGACWLALPVGLLLAPERWLVFAALGGVAQGGVFTIVFLLVVRMSASDRQARRTSALVQGGGYALAALGPSVLGAVHGATGSWAVPLLVVVGSLTVLLLGVGSVAVAAGRRVPEPSPST